MEFKEVATADLAVRILRIAEEEWAAGFTQRSDCLREAARRLADMAVMGQELKATTAEAEALLTRVDSAEGRAVKAEVAAELCKSQLERALKAVA